MGTAEALVENMREHFKDVHFRWLPLVPAGPVALSAAQGAQLEASASRLLDLLRQACSRLGPTPLSRHSALGLDDRLIPLYGEQGFEERYAAVLARPDAILTAQGWRFLEFNVSGAVGGQTYVHLFNDFWRRSLPAEAAAALNLDSPLHARTVMLDRVARELGGERSAVVVGCAADINLKNLRYYEIEVDELRSAGFEAEYYEPGDYAAFVDRTGRAAAVGVQRFVPMDWLDKSRDLEPACLARATPTALLAPQGSTHLANKRLMALLSTGAPWMTDDDVRFCDEHIPWTRLVQDEPTVFHGRRVALPELLLEQQESFVLKRPDGNGGHGVHLGGQTEPGRWRELLETALADGRWVAQERVESVKVPVDVIDPTTNESARLAVPAIFGPVMVDGRVHGCMVRYDTADTREMLTLALPSVLLNSAVWPR